MTSRIAEYDPNDVENFDMGGEFGYDDSELMHVDSPDHEDLDGDTAMASGNDEPPPTEPGREVMKRRRSKEPLERAAKGSGTSHGECTW